jgi:hypothetical protein
LAVAQPATTSSGQSNDNSATRSVDERPGIDDPLVRGATIASMIA